MEIDDALVELDCFEMMVDAGVSFEHALDLLVWKTVDLREWRALFG